MKRLLLLVIPVLALLILAAPVAAEEKHGNSPDTQAASEVEHGKSADAQSRNDERKADFEDEEANSEEDDSAEKNGNGAQRLQFFEVPGGNWETVSDIEVEGRVNLVAPIEGGIWTRTKKALPASPRKHRTKLLQGGGPKSFSLE